MGVAPTQAASAPVRPLPRELDSLISYYHSLPMSANTKSRNVGIEALISRARLGRSADNEIQALCERIRKRCRAIAKAKKNCPSFETHMAN